MSRLDQIIKLYHSNGIDAEIRDDRAWAKIGQPGFVQWYDVTDSTYHFDQ